MSEVEQRKRINIEDRKRIESLLYELKKTQAHTSDIRDVFPLFSPTIYSQL